MGENIEIRELQAGLAHALARKGRGQPENLQRLTGGATMESWRFEVGRERFVLRRAPSLAFMEGRPFGHDVEAAVIRAAHAAGVTAPEVVAELDPEDGIGSGFVMRALPGTPDPRAILAMEEPDQLLREAAGDLARIHSLDPADLPDAIPTLDYSEGVAGLRAQFDEAGGDRPIIALGLKWLEDNVPEPVTPVLNHGDYRLGNILAENSHLTGVLDWELVHFGDPHEDLAFGCMTVWRFSRHDRPAMGLGPLDAYFAAYEEAGGVAVDPARFRFWTIYRTVWWALGCIRMADFWRRGEDRMLERVVISRRTSENELDLLLLLEEDAPAKERAQPLLPAVEIPVLAGEASAGELAMAVSEWLATLKGQMEGHDRFQLAVARNALGMIARGDDPRLEARDAALSEALLAGVKDLASPGLLASLRRSALDKLAADIPKYPALADARAKWTGEN
ncbi:phosphotransferase family protein [Parerythrobacter jejuensis]|uniref:Phosphotransferase n=1 Tax=Parerythrobacter jejuensis TaxID=795812 RepID=A0A845AWD5_9SPHN|nr:phosphotransferase family protein [Parerythrobacter jejuensis]MXP30695.1 phosphotransferase [Parerythrobacter jejuensis]MXP33455.1 phosphotransferase [Parerythrobacter jejuensis]